MSDVVAPKQIKLSLGHQENGSDEPCDIPYHLEASVRALRIAACLRATIVTVLHQLQTCRQYRARLVTYIRASL